MMIKATNKVELDLISTWLTRFGINHTITGFTIKTPRVTKAVKGVFYSALELNEGVSIRHLDWE